MLSRTAITVAADVVRWHVICQTLFSGYTGLCCFVFIAAFNLPRRSLKHRTCLWDPLTSRTTLSRSSFVAHKRHFLLWFYNLTFTFKTRKITALLWSELKQADEGKHTRVATLYVCVHLELQQNGSRWDTGGGKLFLTLHTHTHCIGGLMFKVPCSLKAEAEKTVCLCKSAHAVVVSREMCCCCCCERMWGDECSRGAQRRDL